MLYYKKPNYLRPTDTVSQTPSKESHAIDGAISYTNQQSMSKLPSPTLVITNQIPPSTCATSTSKINVLQ